MTSDLTNSSNGDADRNEADPLALEPGMVVVDRDQSPEERDPAVVMSRPPVPAEQWDLDHIDGTLADDNPDYPPDARAVVVIYRERFEDTEEYDAIPVPADVREKLADGDPVSVAATADLCKFYVFPEPRLEPTGERWPSTPVADDEGDGEAAHIDSGESDHETEPESGFEFNAPAKAGTDAEEDHDTHDPAQVALDRLASVVREAGFSGVQQRDGVIEATKLGKMYRVDHNGEVIEGGAFADKLASFIEEEYDP